MPAMIRLSGAVLAGAVAAACLSIAGPARAQNVEAPKPLQESWSFDGPFGTYDLAAAQRGFMIYQQVCSSCHSMKFMHYRDLAGIGLSPDQIKAIAASVQVDGPLDDNGQPTQRPGLPSDVFKAPFPNAKAAGVAFGGAVPPDQSLLVNAREDGANYIYSLLNGYTDPPAGVKIADGLYYNKYFPGHQIHMPQPLMADQVTYTDGTKATLPQEAHDVVTFLAYASNPEMVERKRTGVKVVLFLALMTGLTYAVKRKVWSNLHH